MQEDNKRVRRFLTKTRQAKDGLTLTETKEKRNWWTDQWIELIEKLESGNRLTQGKKVAKNGQVIYIKVQKGFIIAKVQGERLKPYQIRIEVNKISEEIWGDILAEIASNAFIVAKLFTGKLPERINEIFAKKNTSLIPFMEQDLRAGCTCPDWANPCKHSAAVLLILADMLDEDPFLLFKLRGKAKEELFEIFRVKRNNLANDKSVITKVGVRIISDGYDKESYLYEKSSLDNLVDDLYLQERNSYETSNIIETETTTTNIWSEIEDSPYIINGENLKRLLEHSYKVAKRIAQKKIIITQD